MGAVRALHSMDDDELYVYAKEIRAPVELLRQTKQLGRLPVVNFAAGGVATPADAALMMQLGMDGVFVGSGIFKSGDPASRARAIVQVYMGETLVLLRTCCLITQITNHCIDLDMSRLSPTTTTPKFWQKCHPTWVNLWLALTSERRASLAMHRDPSNFLEALKICIYLRLRSHNLERGVDFFHKISLLPGEKSEQERKICNSALFCEALSNYKLDRA